MVYIIRLQVPPRPPKEIVARLSLFCRFSDYRLAKIAESPWNSCALGTPRAVLLFHAYLHLLLAIVNDYPRFRRQPSRHAVALQ